METNNTPGGKKEHRVFGARFAKQIVKEIEEGLPRKEAMRMHGMSYKSLEAWMSRYGSFDILQAFRLAAHSMTRLNNGKIAVRMPAICRALWEHVQGVCTECRTSLHQSGKN